MEIAESGSAWLTQVMYSRERECRLHPTHPISVGRHHSCFQSRGDMTRPDRRTAFAASFFAAAAVFLLALVVTSSSATAAGAPPYCVARGGTDGGGSTPQDCRYSDYQACLQAAADERGNCVQNIDYHGDISSAMAQAPAQKRHRH
jgi:Protein of unknown function (DUF3551)